ncbi:MAG TPA: hypothetical protein VMN37_07550 [Gemmatimonadales bacterium]|nr:hypothetical protein [Gemmatimonadales bacterium]
MIVSDEALHSTARFRKILLGLAVVVVGLPLAVIVIAIVTISVLDRRRGPWPNLTTRRLPGPRVVTSRAHSGAR